MKKVVRISLLVIFSFAMVFSAWQLWQIFSGYQKGKNSYDSLEQYVSFSATEDPSQTITPSEDSTEDSTAVTEMPDVSAWPQVNFAQLSEINSDIVGWIYLEGTNINYPVVRGSDNDYYLNHLFDGTYNSSGCIFLDYRSASDFSDKHNIIYGHNMKDKSMFAGLMNYKEQSFYNGHSSALLVTPVAYYKVQFFAGYVTDNDDDAWELILDDTNIDEWLRDIQQRSCFVSDYIPEQENRIITLSTCSYEFTNAKFVIHGYIAEEIPRSITE